LRSKISLIRYPTAVSWMNERTSAMPMSPSRSVRCQTDTATARATRTSVAATSESETWMLVVTMPAPVRGLAAGCGRPGALGLGWVVRNEDQGQAGVAPQARDGLLDGFSAAGVQRGGRLVEHEHAGLLGECSGEHHSLLLTDREPSCLSLRERFVKPAALKNGGRVDL